MRGLQAPLRAAGPPAPPPPACPWPATRPLTRSPAPPTLPSCDKELSKLQHQVDLKAERLRREVGAEEGAYQAQVAGLEAQWAAVRGGFGELEGRMTGVTQAATKIGNRLQVGAWSRGGLGMGGSQEAGLWACSCPGSGSEVRGHKLMCCTPCRSPRTPLPAEC